mgnify:CR=1 FL=1
MDQGNFVPSDADPLMDRLTEQYAALRARTDELIRRARHAGTPRRVGGIGAGAPGAAPRGSVEALPPSLTAGVS